MTSIKVLPVLLQVERLENEKIRRVRVLGHATFIQGSNRDIQETLNITKYSH